MTNFFGKELPKCVDLKLGQLEYPGTVVEVLGRRKYRTEDMIATVPDPKHRENIIWLRGHAGSNTNWHSVEAPRQRDVGAAGCSPSRHGPHFP